MSIGTPIISSKQMRRIEEQAFSSGASAEKFMETVASELLELMQDELPHRIGVYVGKGNNGGDGALLANLLYERGFEVDVIALFPISECSELLQKHLKTFEKKKKILSFETSKTLPFSYELVIDALLGTGFSGELKGAFREAIDELNRFEGPVWSIDIPSGLRIDTADVSSQGQKYPPYVIAERTYFLGAPKRCFFEGKNFAALGRLIRVNFGLKVDEPSPFRLIEPTDIQRLLPSINRLRHKFDAGSILGVLSNPKMSGAMALCSLAAFRSGAGFVKLAIREEASPHELAAMAVIPPEVVRCFYHPQPNQGLRDVLQELGSIKACVIGPGYAQDRSAERFLKLFLKEVNLPIVIDGGALGAFVKKRVKYPKVAVLTPHLGELKRLLPISQFPSEEAFELCQRFVEEKRVTLVVKGAPTFIFHPEEPVLVSPFGSPAMATAGSGDVLSGVIAAQLSAGLGPREAAVTGAALHGLAGEFASEQLSPYSLIASDIVEQLPRVLSYFSPKIT
jgi:ADP-dependent NAD(P)H-hydrate dehydratase / NAD(P)H-hydrate epimerase